MSSRKAALAWIACVALVGCSSKTASDTHSAAPPMAQSDTSGPHGNDPCSLLEPKEVEAVLGAPLGTPPFRASNGTPQADGDDCEYLTADFSRIIFTVTFEGGAQSYQMTGFGKKLLSGAPTAAARNAFKMDDGTEITGEWDEAQLTAMNCCIFNALRADQMITIDFTATDAALPRAASLVDAAFKRIDKPLALDGGANVAAAKAFLATRPKRRDPCSVLSQKEVEAVVGSLTAAPSADGAANCSYPIAPEGGMPRAYVIHYLWEGGIADVRSTGHIVNVGGMAMGGAPAKAEDPLPPKAAPGEPWDRAGVMYNDFVALKKDVEVKIDHRGLDDAKVKALVAAAMRKI
jgi:hypothetical protein